MAQWHIDKSTNTFNINVNFSDEVSQGCVNYCINKTAKLIRSRSKDTTLLWLLNTLLRDDYIKYSDWDIDKGIKAFHAKYGIIVPMAKIASPDFSTTRFANY